jgi:hypothetical protein
LLETHPDDVPAHVLEGGSEHSDYFKPFEYEPDLFTDKVIQSTKLLNLALTMVYLTWPQVLIAVQQLHAPLVLLAKNQWKVKSALQSTATDLTESATCSSKANTTPVSLSLPPHSTPVNLSNQSTPGSAASNSAGTTRKPLTNLTEFLNCPTLTSTPKPSKKAKPSNGPRVLTSAEAIAMLEEKERKKRRTR